MDLSIVDISIYIVSLILLIYLSGRFSGSETALTSLTEMDIAEMKLKNVKNMKYIEKLVGDINRTIIAILVGNNLVNVLASTLAALLFQELLSNVGVSISVGVMTLSLLIFGEITPKAYALKNKQQISIRNARYVYFVSITLGRPITLLKWIARSLSKLYGEKIPKVEFHLQEKNIKFLAKKGAASGEIKNIEKDIIHRVFTFGDRKVKEAMIPANEVIYLTSNTSVVEAKKKMVYHGYTRIPVIKSDKKKKIIGIIYTKDLLNRLEGRIKDFMRKAYVVSPEKDITKVFNEMKRRRRHIGIVSDKKRRFLGIITLEDILEELVGEIYDEFDEKITHEKKKISSRKKGLKGNGELLKDKSRVSGKRARSVKK